MGKTSGLGLYPVLCQESEIASFPPWKVMPHGPSYQPALLPSVVGKRSIYYVLGTALNFLQIIYLISKQPSEVDIYWYACFMDEEAEAQMYKVTCLRTHGY